jgi:hypothetical protein
VGKLAAIISTVLSEFQPAQVDKEHCIS